MANNTFYFSHDYNSRNDPKLLKLLMKHGQEGKGIFWDIIEMLYEQDGYLLLSEMDSFSFSLRTTNDKILSIITDFDLFYNDGTKFWSNSVNKRIEKIRDKSTKAKESALKRWGNTQQPQQQTKKKTKFIPPTLKEVTDYFTEHGYSKEIGKKAFHYYDSAGWIDSRKKPVSNWKQKMLGNWFKDENKQQQTPINQVVI